MNRQPRGVRNQNPGNLRWGDPWQGLVPMSQRNDPDFCQFVAPAWGIRAMAITLISYQDRHDIHTVEGIVARWAPPVENDTKAYVRSVAFALDVLPNQHINVHRYAVMEPLVRAIIRHENGRARLRDGDWYDRITVDEGLRMAGIVAPARGLPTPVGVAAAAGGTAAAVEAAQQMQPLLGSVNQMLYTTAGWPAWLQVAGAVLVLVSLGALVLAWWRQRRARRAVAA